MTDLTTQGIISAFSSLIPPKRTRNVIIAGGQTFNIEDLRAHADRAQARGPGIAGEMTGSLLHALIDGADTDKLEYDLREAKREVVDLRSDIKWALTELEKLRAMDRTLAGEGQSARKLAEVIEALTAALS